VKSGARSAFTLLELLLAIGLVALLSAGLIAGSVSLLNDRPVFPQEVFWQASHAARKTALLNAAVSGGHEVRLSYDDKQKAFIADDGVAPQTFLVAKAPPDLVVQFLPPDANANPGAPPPPTDDTSSLPYVTFYGDGTCSPFNLQLRTKSGTQRFEIDPWTCAQMLKAPPAP
jgi:type II secretory pathway pseudopilin PulG